MGENGVGGVECGTASVDGLKKETTEKEF
ncbi:uncharacterized protein G2W53_037431 [Senna tora]|uniref:Uncharacterized protein n=1 Tax=Senna tora TaxID=362788 RepID=A0A834SW71_9FABA|nr:uncharacterized protein G2W53_037431 [Senna tora]